MAHISSIGAGLYSHLAICRETYSGTLPANQAAWEALFVTEIAPNSAPTASPGEFSRLPEVREFPSIGTPPNIVNVPVYGQKTSKQIQGQADAPSMEITINYVGDDWANTTNYLGDIVGDGKEYAFRFTLMNTDSTASGATKYASSAGGIGTVENTSYFFIGKIEAILVNPQLTDANTATITITVQSEFYGAWTI